MNNLPQYIVILTVVFSLLLGATVLFGWHSGKPAFIQVNLALLIILFNWKLVMAGIVTRTWPCIPPSVLY